MSTYLYLAVPSEARLGAEDAAGGVWDCDVWAMVSTASGSSIPADRATPLLRAPAVGVGVWVGNSATPSAAAISLADGRDRHTPPLVVDELASVKRRAWVELLAGCGTNPRHRRLEESPPLPRLAGSREFGDWTPGGCEDARAHSTEVASSNLSPGSAV